MTDNIQQPVKANIRDITNEYGSHYVASCVEESIVELIGPIDRLNKWHCRHNTLESAKASILDHLKKIKTKEKELYESKKESAAWKICKILSALKIASSQININMKEINDNIILVENEINQIICGDYEIEIEMLQGECLIPKYMIEKNVSYYHLNLSRLNNIRINEVILDDEGVRIYENRGVTSSNKFADQFSFLFVHYLRGVNLEVMLSSENLLKFNGKYFELSSQNEFLFVNKKDALKFAKEFSEEKIKSFTKEIEKIDDELKIINT